MEGGIMDAPVRCRVQEESTTRTAPRSPPVSSFQHRHHSGGAVQLRLPFMADRQYPGFVELRSVYASAEGITL